MNSTGGPPRSPRPPPPLLPQPHRYAPEMPSNAQRKHMGARTDGPSMPELQVTDGLVLVENEIHAYQTRRQRRRAQLRKEKFYRLSPDAADIVQCARMWVPFGGPPADEIFVRFGMSQTRFTERLWQIVGDIGCDPEMVCQLRTVYAPRRVSCSPRGDATRQQDSSLDPSMKEER